MSKTPLISLPGQRLSVSNESYVSGFGTFEFHGYIYSKLLGTVDVIEKDGLKVIEVRSLTQPISIPAPGDVVTAQIHLITQQYAGCLIKCVGKNILENPFKGVIRRENVRAKEKDKVEIYKSYRPGDIILARVLPMTETKHYQLSTAENELGVVTAHSEYGYPMVPISWIEMQCSKTLIKEYRKVAKVVPENMNRDLLELLES